MEDAAHYCDFSAELAHLDVGLRDGGPCVFKPVVVVEKDC